MDMQKAVTRWQMSLGLGALQVQRGAQSFHGTVIRLFELFERSGKLSGSLLDQLLQLPDAAVFFIFHGSLAV